MNDKKTYRERATWLFKKWIKVDKDGCWLWLGMKNTSGYGHVRSAIWNERLLHRISYIYHVGRIPKNKCVLHHCDKKNCLNPKCLFVGTNQDNSVDMVKKRRHPVIKLGTDADIHFIRESALSQRMLGKMFGVCQAEISQIKNHKRWKHVKELTR